MEAWVVNALIGFGGLVIATYGLKFGKAYLPIKKTFNLIVARHNAKKDGHLSKEEKAELYDKIEDCVKEAYSVMKGFFPNKSK